MKPNFVIAGVVISLVLCLIIFSYYSKHNKTQPQIKNNMTDIEHSVDDLITSIYNSQLSFLKND